MGGTMHRHSSHSPVALRSPDGGQGGMGQHGGLWPGFIPHMQSLAPAGNNPWVVALGLRQPTLSGHVGPPCCHW